MNTPLIWRMAVWEFRLLTRGAAFWLGIVASSGVAVNLAIHGVQSPGQVAYGLTNWILPIIPLLFLPVLGAVRRRDAGCGIHELVHSRPVSGLDYVVSKLAAGWAALAATWLASMLVGALVAAAVEPGSLVHWPGVMLMSGALALPCYAFVTALAMAVDALTGRTGAVLGVGALVVIGSWLYVGSIRGSILVPLFLPRYISAVFGFDPYAGLMWLSRAWVLALTTGLLALALRLLPRRTPLLVAPGARRLTALLLTVMVVGGSLTAVPLLRAPAHSRWDDAARDWEMAQISAATAGSPQKQAYWTRRLVETPTVPVEVYVARGSEETTEALGRAAARLLPYFPELQPMPGEPLRLFQGSYLRHGRLASGSLVVLSKDVRLAAKGKADRVVLRAMTEGYWSNLARVPAYVPGEVWIGSYFPFELDDTWASGPALYHQWVALEQMVGAEAAALERQYFGDYERKKFDSGPDLFMELNASGAVGYGRSGVATGYALALWDTGQKVGHDRVLDALKRAAVQVGPPTANEMAAWQRARKPYWAAVSDLLGTDLTEVRPINSWSEAVGEGG